MKNLLKFFSISKNTKQGKNNASLLEDIYIDVEEEIEFAKAVDYWETVVWPLERAKEREQEQKDLLAFIEYQQELYLEYWS